MSSEKNFKKISLNRELIQPALHQWKSGVNVETKPKEKFLEYRIVIPNQEAALLHVYHNQDGTTTLHHKVGQNQSLSLEVAEYIKDKCQVGNNVTRQSLSIADVTEEKLLLILEFLKESEATVSESIQIQHGKQYKVSGKQGDTLTFSLFNTGTLQIQGKPLLLYSETVEILSVLFDYEKVILAQLKVIQVNITVDEVVSELKILMPNAYSFIGDKLVTIISPALALRKLDIALTDYSSFVFPALRGLEGYVKLVFSNQLGISIGKDGFGEHFQKGSLDWTLKTSIRVAPKIKTCQAIEKSYKYYHDQRHGLFHADSEPNNIRVVPDKNGAHDIINQTIKIIEETYTSTIT